MRIKEHKVKGNKTVSKWKDKAKARSKEIKFLKQSLRRSRQSSALWRERYVELKKCNEATPLALHYYGVEIIGLAVLMRIYFNASLRSISATLKCVSEWRGYRYKGLCASTIRSWSLRVGLYCLRKPIAAGSYVLILDESVGLYKEKILVIMAVPIDESCSISPLQLRDVQVWAVQSKSSWKGPEIAEIIKQKQGEEGVNIAYALSDGGGNLLHGIRLCELKQVMDCTHALANCSKRLFIKDVPFNAFIKEMNALRAKWVLSKFSPYLPPALRAKSRFHQLFTVSKWANQILFIWDEIPQEALSSLQFVMQSRSLIATMTKLHQLIEQFANIFKPAGIQSESLCSWQNICQQCKIESAQKKEMYDYRINQFLDVMNQYLRDQQLAVPHAQQILCCSDVIESAFGKYKNKGGSKAVSDDILQIAAYPIALTKKEAIAALTSVSSEDLKLWKSSYSVPIQPSIHKIVNAKMETHK
mgnify:CR=1 FL=1